MSKDDVENLIAYVEAAAFDGFYDATIVNVSQAIRDYFRESESHQVNVGSDVGSDPVYVVTEHVGRVLRQMEDKVIADMLTESESQQERTTPKEADNGTGSAPTGSEE